MSKSIINIGALPNDGTGDSLRSGATKVNNNFGELYDTLGDGNNLSVGVGKTIIGISSSTYNVGIGSTIPASKLTVIGDLSATSYKLGTTEVISSSGQLKNISSLDVTTTATIESAIQAAPNTFNDLQITGVSTFLNGPVLVGTSNSTGTQSQSFQVVGGVYISGNVGLGTTNPTSPFQVGTGSSVVVIDSLGDVGIGTTVATSKLHVIGNTLLTGVSTVYTGIITNLNVTGFSTLGSISAQNLTLAGITTGINVSGFSTLGSISAQNLTLAGITTGINVSGVITASSISAQNLTLAGITTGINVSGVITASSHVANQGTSTVAPFQFASTGALLTGNNGALGAVEYDGQNYYATGVTTTGRGFIPTVNSFRFTSNRSVQSPVTGSINYFDPGLIPLTGNGVYEVDFDLYFTKGTTGITTFTLSTPSAPTNISAVLTSTPATGVSTNSPSSPQFVSVVGGATTSTSLALTLNAATHYTKISVFVENSTSNTNTLTLNTTNTGTITPLRGSRWKATLLTRTAGVGVTQ
jgi:hypothetical protein